MLELALVKKEVRYTCGCYAFYHLICAHELARGHWIGNRCIEHYTKIENEDLEKRAEQDWQREIEGQPVLTQDYK